MYKQQNVLITESQIHYYQLHEGSSEVNINRRGVYFNIDYYDYYKGHVASELIALTFLYY